MIYAASICLSRVAKRGWIIIFSVADIVKPKKYWHKNVT
jgi:hypothetical protein